MDIKLKSVGEIQVVELDGDIDASTAPDVTKFLSELVKPSIRLLLDMTKVPYMSSAGLRTLLSLHRQITNKEGKVVLVGLSEELVDTMSVTGFLDFFIAKPSQEEGLATLA
ncbi:MAG: STAS domain-containing protein [Pseudanabaena sp.]|jgi:anti-sigma B factor antagonist